MYYRSNREGNVKASQVLASDSERNEFLHQLVDFLDRSCHEGFNLNQLHEGIWEGEVCSFNCVALSQSEAIFQTMQYKFDRIRRGETGYC